MRARRRWVIEIRFQDEWALVGGASQGIGQATAKRLAESGARVILMSRRPEALEETRAALTSPGQHMIFPVDLEQPDDLQNKIQRLVQQVGPIPIWINNTGGPKAGPLNETSVDEIEKALRGHVLASQIILKALLPGMKQQGWGRIINVLSTSVKVPIPNLGVSNLTRAAMASWSKTLSLELGAFHITVNNVLPGYTDTPRLKALAKTPDAYDKWKESIPLKRLGQPEETAAAITFLASRLADYISGIHLPVDGGRTGAF